MCSSPNGVTACMDEIEKATAELNEALCRHEHPNRIRDYVRDVERWCIHMHGHMSALADN